MLKFKTLLQPQDLGAWQLLSQLLIPLYTKVFWSETQGHLSKLLKLCWYRVMSQETDPKSVYNWMAEQEKNQCVAMAQSKSRNPPNWNSVANTLREPSINKCLQNSVTIRTSRHLFRSSIRQENCYWPRTFSLWCYSSLSCLPVSTNPLWPDATYYMHALYLSRREWCTLCIKDRVRDF